MNLMLKEMEKSPKFKEYIEQVKLKKGPIIVSGLVDVGMIQLLATTAETLDKPLCIVTYNELQARKIVEDFKCFEKQVVYFPKKEIVTYDYIADSKELPYERIEALIKIRQRKAKVVVTTIEALMQGIPTEEELFRNEIELQVGKEYNLQDIKQKLQLLGYERYELIEGKGQFSNRGGILDISLTEEMGVRIEFWGDEIDSIRYFNIVTQRSTEMIKKITIHPRHEFVFDRSIDMICEAILKRNYTPKQLENAKEDIERIKNGEAVSKIDKYFDCFYEKTGNLLYYLSSKYIVALDEIGKIKTRAQNILNDNQSIQKTLAEKDRIIPDAILNLKSYQDIDEIMESYPLLYLEKNDFGMIQKGEKYNFPYREINFYRNNIEEFLDEIQSAKEKKKKVYLYIDSKEKAKKLSELLNEREIIHEYKEDLEESEIPNHILVYITIGKLSSGFESYDTKMIVIQASNLIEGVKRKRKKALNSFREAEKVVFADLKIGDYIVHRTHGIGQFIGVNTIKADGTTKDYIKIKYRNDDVLYIPTDQLDNIRKYIGGGEALPKLNRLGSKEWDHTKAKVKKNLREVARELIELYAKRQKIVGYAFSKDTPWQSEFENSFPYQETEDQLRCIDEIKKDMESPKTMDRLLCGDVGYGKTEVAIRAAFKAVMDQKQVCYLVPTTVLADQQYQSFKERMEQFPIRVEVLNRFRTKKQQEQIIRKLKLGEIDVIIGTHRLLSNDVEFQDLGLLIIDEEHRFGVKAKEKIKEYKANVDVLTMTATPIPRTLHMSIVGIRDMSVIYEPPQNRKPVQTYVLEYDADVVREAITKELERNGQVFYLFNNVEAIIRKADEISNLVPEAKVAFAHGKMTGNELENIMMDFIHGDINVLVCTTILESGIDIPNANTVIVENADRLGLAQLYQIRGRVGRSNTQAYAYITYKRDKLLSEIADKRLKAMKEFTELGSGFKIAMRDLEIRGAGSLLRRNSTWAYGTSRL